MADSHMPVVGLLLAGGRSSRMGGGDKCLAELGGRPVLAHVIDRLRPQVQVLILSANGDAERFAQYGLPVVADSLPDFQGPLAGILAGLEWSDLHRPNLPWVLSVPTDAPFLPRDLARRLVHACEGHRADLGCAASDGRSHPVVGLWPTRLRRNLHRAIVEEGVRKVDAWTAQYRLATVEFPTDEVDSFFNINTPEDLAEAERLMSEG